MNVAYVGIGARRTTTAVDEKYMLSAQAAITVQLQRAGVRLANVLNEVFMPAK